MKIKKKDRKKLLRKAREENGKKLNFVKLIPMTDRTYGVLEQPSQFRYEQKDNTWVKMPRRIVSTYYRIWNDGGQA